MKSLNLDLAVKFIKIVMEKTGYEDAFSKIGPNGCVVQAISGSSDVHYELLISDNKVFLCFHNEAPSFHNVRKKFEEVIRKNQNYNSMFGKELRYQLEVNDLEKLEEETKRLIDILRPILEEAYPNDKALQQYGKSQVSCDSLSSSEPVKIVQQTVDFLLEQPLYIPEYQREYCWNDKNIKDMFNDIKAKNGIYFLGTIILKKEEDEGKVKYAVIDGQQRLTTLAIWKWIYTNDDEKQTIHLLYNKSNRITTKEGRNALRDARSTIEAIGKKDICLNKLMLSVIVLGENQPEDLAYTFFSTSNSTGKKLSDFDLLKSHHLRYIQQEDIAEMAVKRWHELEKSNILEPLLHSFLFRLRNWCSGTEFAHNELSNLDSRNVYHHFSCRFKENPVFGSGGLPQFRFNSILPGGQMFFEYIEYYRRQYVNFLELKIIKDLDNALGYYNNGVIRDGIKAIAFLFYCKYGSLYLKEAVYALAYWLSQLRNQYSIFQDYLGKPVRSINRWYVQEATDHLDRFTTPSQFLSWLLDTTNQYTIERVERTQGYWEALLSFLATIEKEIVVLQSIKMSDILFKQLSKFENRGGEK